jgi:hypothetical protein
MYVGREDGGYARRRRIVAKRAAESTRDVKIIYKIPLHGCNDLKNEKIEGHGYFIYNREQAGVSGPNGGCWK